MARAYGIALAAGILATTTLALPQAQAAYIGQTVQATAYFPTLPGSTVGGPVSAVVGAGVEFTNGQFGAFFGPSFDFDDTTITITHAQSGHQPGTFNGYQFLDLLAAIPDITGVSIQSDSTGFFSGDPGRVFFDADNVYVNFQGLDFAGQNTPTIVLQVAFGTAVPEPAALAILGIGLLGLAGLRRRSA